MTKTINWDEGGGNITLTFSSHTGNQVINITSSPNTLTTSRSKEITFSSGTKSTKLQIVQAGNIEDQSVIINLSDLDNVDFADVDTASSTSGFTYKINY